ncbi:MAG: nucleotidyltransferase domain-containing protein, partial [Anaerolineae bacterium]
MVRRIVAAADPVKVILMGSHAWGTAQPDSDVDL